MRPGSPRGDCRQRGRGSCLSAPAGRAFHRNPWSGIRTYFRCRPRGNAGKTASQAPPARLSHLAGLRATYANLLSEATNRAKLSIAPSRIFTTPIRECQRQGRERDFQPQRPEHRHPPDQPRRIGDRLGRPARRTVHRVRIRSTHRAGGRIRRHVIAGSSIVFYCGSTSECRWGLAGHPTRSPRRGLYRPSRRSASRGA